MKIFKPVTLRWWQMAIFKLTVASAGTFVGVLFADHLRPLLGFLLVLSVAGSLYLMILGFTHR